MKRTDLRTIQGSGEPADHVYVNMSIINNGTDDIPEDKFPLCELSEVSSSSIIEETGDYDLAVVKFSMDGITQFLPIFHFMTQPGETNKGIYSVTLTCLKGDTTYTSQQYVTYTPQNPNLRTPSDNNKSSEYYDCHCVNYVLDLFNKGIESAFVSVIGQVPNRDPSVKPPRLYFNPATNLISMRVGRTGWGRENTMSGADKEEWNIYFNQNTYNVLKTFPYENMSEADGKKFKILIGEVDYNPWADADTEYTLSQEFASIGSYWSPVESLVLLNNGGDMNINQTYQSTPVRLNRHSFGKKGISENYTENIITEFSIDKSNPQAWTENLLYAPENYRFYSLMSKGHIKHIQLQWFYRQRLTGELREIRMPNQSSCHLSLLFKRHS